MLRTVFAAAMLVVAATSAHAESAPPAELKLSFDSTRLATDAGRETLKQEVARTVESYCRAKPVEGTVASCKASLVANANSQIDAEAHAYAQRRGTIELTDTSLRTASHRPR